MLAEGVGGDNQTDVIAVAADKTAYSAVGQSAVEYKQRYSMWTVNLFQYWGNYEPSDQFKNRVSFQMIQFFYQYTDSVFNLFLGMRRTQEKSESGAAFFHRRVDDRLDIDTIIEQTIG